MQVVNPSQFLDRLSVIIDADIAVTVIEPVIAPAITGDLEGC
jgi:hypothetical protein